MSLRVLVQAGHLLPLEPGIRGLGAAGEVELNTQIRDLLVRLLNDDRRYEAIPAAGHLPDGIHSRRALPALQQRTRRRYGAPLQPQRFLLALRGAWATPASHGAPTAWRWAKLKSR